jgi:hypothetical protein
LIVYLGWYRATEIVVPEPTVEEVVISAMKVDCFECHGTGRWPYHPEQRMCCPVLDCVVCKGTGKVFINV